MENKISQELYNYVVKVLDSEPHFSDVSTHTWSPDEDVYVMIKMAQDSNIPTIIINDNLKPNYMDKAYQIIGFCLHYNQAENINLIYDFTK